MYIFVHKQCCTHDLYTMVSRDGVSNERVPYIISNAQVLAQYFIFPVQRYGHSTIYK